MNKIYIILIQLLFAVFPRHINALKKVTNYQNSIGGFTSVEFSSPILMILNISAFVVLSLSIIWFMKGYTTKDLAHGNVKEMDNGNKLLLKCGIGFLYILIVFIIDLNIY